MKSKLTEQKLIDNLEGLIDGDDEVIILYSGISSFAHKFGADAKHTANMILDVFQNVCGNERTLVLPSYSMEFSKSKIFDIKFTKTDTGALSDCAILRSEMLRTNQPMQSYIAYGKLKNDLSNLKTQTSWGNESIMSWLIKNKAKIMVLGIDWHLSCSILHHAEEVLRVPYRYFKRFSGKLYSKGDYIGECEEIMYCRPKNIEPLWDHKQIEERLRNKKKIISAENPILPLEAISISSYVNETYDILYDNPYAYIKNVEEIKYWVNNIKEDEIKSMSKSEIVINE